MDFLPLEELGGAMLLDAVYYRSASYTKEPRKPSGFSDSYDGLL